jgi:hypothetical protein
MLQSFVRDGRLIRLPAKATRRKELLRYLAIRDFRPRTWYAEHEVNEILRAWCAGADATDHVSIRRYPIEYRILDREDAGVTGCSAPGRSRPQARVTTFRRSNLRRRS